jgi:hypothetical protein
MNKRKIFKSLMLLVLLFNAVIAMYDGRLDVWHWLQGLVAGGLIVELFVR